MTLLGKEGAERVRAAHGGTFERLADIERRYDPDSLFHVKQNIAPGSSATRAG